MLFSLMLTCSVSEEKKSEEDMTRDEEEAEMSDGKMIDDMFESVLSQEEEEMFTPLRRDSPLTIPSLTRQKSRLEVKCELNVVCCLNYIYLN